LRASPGEFTRGRRALAAGALLVLLSSCNDLPTESARAPHLELRAFSVASWTRFGYASPAGRQALEEISDVGANAVVFVYTVYQASARSSELIRDHPATPDLSALATAVAHARSLDLEAILKLHVDVADGTWRGLIEPEDARAWFGRYREELGRLAQFAATNGAERLVIGTELASTMEHEGEWRDLIAFVRGVYSGEIWYAASWDEVERVPFWEELDVIGVDFYFPVADRRDPSRLEVLEGWQPWLDRLDALHERLGKSVVLTEIGYMSRDGAGMDPADYGLSAGLDLEEQADLYWGALEAVAAEDWIAGLCWWSWDIGVPGGPADRGFTPRGKPALSVVEEAWNGAAR
jgi:hypothetical protein